MCREHVSLCDLCHLFEHKRDETRKREREKGWSLEGARERRNNSG